MSHRLPINVACDRPGRHLGPNETPRLLFVGEGVSLAHVSRPTVLASWAREAGYDVMVACSARFADVVHAEWLPWRELPTIPPQLFYERVARAQFFYEEHELAAYVEADRELLRSRRPELVVGDFRLSMGIAAALEGLPLLSLANAYWSPGARCRLGRPPSGLLPGWPYLLRQSLFLLVRPILWRLFGSTLNRVRRQHGLPPLRDFREQYTAGTWCAYLDAPELVPVDAMPDGHFYLGPVPWQPCCHCAVSPPRGDGPLAYVSLGSSGDARVLPAVLSALTRLGWRAVVSGTEPPGGEMWSERIQFTRLIDPRPILARAAVTVCHGGNGTVYQSLAAGVPVLSLPGNPDQWLMAQAVADSGCGAWLDPLELQPDAVSNALRALQCDGPRRHAGDIASILHNSDSRRRWLQFLERAVPMSLVSRGREHEHRIR